MGPYDKPFSPQEYLMHYGVKGMKWGVRRYQNKDGTLTKAGKERYSQNQQDGVDSFLKSVGSKKVSDGRRILKTLTSAPASPRR